jgi:oxygen-dependent protoporphyrinogen oxidase
VGEVPRLEVCGAAYDGIGVAACVADGQRAATRVLAQLAGEGGWSHE